LSSERYTRKEIIDKMRKTPGWDVNNKIQVLEEYELEVGLPEGVSESLSPDQGKQFRQLCFIRKRW
jgi:type I restriction enzyme R subunit